MTTGTEVGQWQIDVTDKLGRLIQQTSDLTDQVKRQNGNVGRLWNEMDGVKTRISAVESLAASNRAVAQAKEKATEPWKRWAERLVFAVLGVLAVLTLLHAPEVLKTLAH